MRGLLDSSARAAYLSDLDEAFEQAAARVGVVERFYSVAGHLVHVRFAGDALLPCVDSALEHVAASAAAAPSLTVCAWDGVSTGVQMPAAPSGGEPGASAAVVDGEQDPVQTAFNLLSNELTVFDARAGRGLLWVGDARAVPYGERAAPLRVILHWWANRHGMQVVHGAAVGTPAGAVLLTGRSGSGKSTTALACLRSELRYLGDDYVLVAAEPRPRVWSLFNSAKLHADALARLPHLRDWVSNPEPVPPEKAVMFLHRHCPEKLLLEAPLRAIVSPRSRGGEQTRLVSATGVETLLALAPSTLFQLHGARHRSFALMSRLVRETPRYAVELGTDLAAVPRALASVLDGPRADGR